MTGVGIGRLLARELLSSWLSASADDGRPDATFGPPGRLTMGRRHHP